MARSGAGRTMLTALDRRGAGLHCSQSGFHIDCRLLIPNLTSLRNFAMNKLISILVASTFALAGASAMAADPPKDASATKAVAAKLEKPASVTTEAWAKMSDTEKQKAVDEAKAKTPAARDAAPKKE